MNSELKQYWQEQNALWKKSGLTQQAFCENHGLNYNQFIYYRSELKRKERPSSSSSLACVSVSTDLPPAKQEDKGLEVILTTGIKLRIKTKADIKRAQVFIQSMGGCDAV